jgi:hypothetical protein
MKRFPLIAALLLAVLGGIYFGLFSCGGYAWHKPAFFAALAAATLTALLVPLQRTRPVANRFGTVVAIGVAFLLTQAIAAPFYPAPPTSWAEFMRIFLHTLEQGPC